MTHRVFILKSIILLIILIITDFSIGLALERLYFNQKGEEYFYATKAINIQDSALVVLGSSRARNHYDTSIISDSLNISAYNAGRSGCFLVYQSAQLDLILDRYTPKVIILEVTPYDMEKGEGDFDRLSGLLPYHNHASYNQVLERRSPYERFKCLSRIYPYNSLLLKMINNQKDNGEFQPDGFQPLDGKWSGKRQKLGVYNKNIDLRKQKEMEHIIKQCNKHKIQLIMVTSPFYADYSQTRTIEITDSICKNNQIPYISFLNHPLFKNPSLYHTADHLNKTGAKLFSKIIAGNLKTTLRKYPLPPCSN